MWNQVTLDSMKHSPRFILHYQIKLSHILRLIGLTFYSEVVLNFKSYLAQLTLQDQIIPNSDAKNLFQVLKLLKEIQPEELNVAEISESRKI